MIQLMCRDTVVLEFDFDELHYKVHHPELLPWSLKGSIREIPKPEDFSDTTKYIKTATFYNNKNRDAIMYFITSRVLSLSRTNAKKILTSVGFTPQADIVTKARLSFLCRSVTLQDDYWVKKTSENIHWEEVNIRNKSLNQALTQVALHGRSISLQGNIGHSPEFTTQGAYAKAWVREDDGLYLYKKGATDPTEAKIEVEVSRLLDFCNVPHLKYERAEIDDIVCCKCKLMSSDKVSMMHAEDFLSYCNKHGLDFDKEVCKIDKDTYYKMWIVDYLIANSDRHGLNWGFFYDPQTTKIIGCHPLYDHNNAFDNDVMNNPEHNYIVNGKSMRDCAKFAMKQVDFHFTREPDRSDFLTTKHYNSFMNRAKELGIKTIKSKELSTSETSVSEKTEQTAPTISL